MMIDSFKQMVVYYSDYLHTCLHGRAAAAEECKAKAEREAAAAATKVTRHEQQLNELYDLCNTQQGGFLCGTSGKACHASMPWLK